jgi:hypothetical protein
VTPTPKKRLYSFFIEPSQLAALKALQARDGVLPSESIRRAVDAWLRRKGVTKKTGRSAGGHPPEHP